jgi:hypothetical protein
MLMSVNKYKSTAELYKFSSLLYLWRYSIIFHVILY